MRSLVVVVKAVASGASSVEAVLEWCGRVGVGCAGVRSAVDYLVEVGVLDDSGGVLRLTGYGREVADALKDFEEGVSALACGVLEGRYTHADVYAHMLTPMASLLGAVAMVCEEPSRYTIRLAMALHGYVSMLTAAVLLLLAARVPEFGEVVEKIEKEIYGGLEG